MALSWSSAQGQQMFVPSSPTYGQIPSVDQAAASPISSLPGALLGELFALQSVPLRAGAVEFHPHLGYQFQYGDGILLTPGNQQTTALNTITPGLGVQIGQNWFADLTLNINQYSNPDFQDYLGYSLSFGGRIPFEEWTVSLGGNSSLSDQSQLQTASQTKQIDNSWVASGTRSFSSRVSIELSASQTTQLANAFNDPIDVNGQLTELNNQWSWSTLNWLNYQATPKTSVGVGVGAGYNLIDPGIDSVFQQLQGRVSWFASSKLSVQVSGGVQFQQFLDPDAGDTAILPLFSLGVTYKPFEPTLLSLSASQSVGNSDFGSDFTQTRSIGVGLNQRLFKNFNLSVQPSYSFTRYRSALGNLDSTQEDKYFSFYAGLSTTVLKKLGVSVFYRFNDQQSNQDGFSTSGSIVGFSLNYRY